MLAKSANINVRIDPEIKLGAEKLFDSLGITLTDAINIFLRKSIMEGGIPFDMKQQYFNAETETAIQEARDIITGKTSSKSYHSARELFEELDKEMDGE